jgi:hypothetical protein
MQRMAVFGNTGGGKSTLARRLADLTHLPLYPLDKIQYRNGGDLVPHDEYLAAHAELLRREQWIIDGYGCTASSWERFARADTLVYIDLPLVTHYWWVAKRHFQGLFVDTPEGWPERPPMWRSTMNSLKVVALCNRHLTPKYRQLVAEAVGTKRVHHLRSPAGIGEFLASVQRGVISATTGA